MVAPNSPSARAQHSAIPAPSDGAISGRVTRRRIVQRPAPRVAAASSIAPVHGPQPGLDGDDQERHGHERLGQDGPGGGERQGDPERPVEPLADQPAAAEGQQQGHPADDRRQHHRQGGEGPHQVAPGELDPGQQEGQGDAEGDRHRHRPGRADQRQPQRLQHPGAGQLGAEAPPRGPPEQADQGDGQEPDGQGGGDGEGSRHPAPGGRDSGGRPAPAAPSGGGHVVGGGRNPYCFRTCWPSAPSTWSMNACAWSWALLALTVAIG